MPDEKVVPEQPATPEPIAVALEVNPKADLLGKINHYAYSTVAQIIASANDVRIAFGDQLPPDGRIEPLFGVTISHEHARRLAASLTQQIQRIDKMMGAIRAGKQPLRLPPELSGAVNFKVLKSPERGAYGIWASFRDGKEITLEGDRLTPEINNFIAGLESASTTPAPQAMPAEPPSPKKQ